MGIVILWEESTIEEIEMGASLGMIPILPDGSFEKRKINLPLSTDIVATFILSRLATESEPILVLTGAV